jgi:hypothetical protein
LEPPYLVGSRPFRSRTGTSRRIWRISGPSSTARRTWSFRLATKALDLEQSGLSYQRVPPGTWRGYEAGPEGLEILVFGAPNLGEDPREDVEGQRDWWAD